MKLGMLCKTAPVAFAVLVGGMAMSAPAMAQDDGITVLSPYTVKKQRERGSITGAENITVSTRVTYRDLNLRYRGDIDELYRRVDFAAQDVCRQANMVQPVNYSTSDTRTCYLDAKRDARRQVLRAVTNANRW